MKFDPGQTFEEYLAEQGEWHDFFALLPRCLAAHDCRWLETIQRRRTWVEGDFYPRPGYWRTEYRAKEAS